MSFLKEIKKISISTIIISFIAGLLFIAFPAQCIKYTSLFLGAALIAMGVVSVISYLANKSSMISLIMGVIVGICGIIICVKYKAIISVIVAIFGIFILASGVIDMATSIRSIITLRISGWVTMVLSIVTIVFGIIAITKSTQLTEGIVQFIGVALLIYAVLDLIVFFQVRKIAKNAKSKAELNGDIDVEGNIVE